MSIVTDASAADHVDVRVVGKIGKEELSAFRSEFEGLVRGRGKLRILFDATEFTGWEADALWQEAKFDFKHLGDIERLAMVGAKSWQKAIETAARPFVRADMRYFDSAEMNAAADWVKQADTSSRRG
ncbi:MAG TPA: STAS/SEC14 domain-containing protein [Terracidiphilus sp.]|jgi:hypothetical protein